MSLVSDEYRTIKQEMRFALKVKGSRFIASASPSITKSDADEFILRVKKHFHDATHNCYAYRCGTDGSVYRFNDDGEPSGTAGKPILGTIEKFDLTEVCVVVTRYFGGTKLGVGGLVRAYSDAAEGVLTAAEHVTKHLLDTMRVSFPHAQISTIMHIVSRLGARIAETTYDEEVHLVLEIRRSKAKDLRASMANQTSGNIRISP